MSAPVGRGWLFVLEGIDGAGHTTHASLLKEWLEKNVPDYQYKILITSEPTNGPFGAILRLAIQGRIQLSPEAMALAFAADRMDHIKTVIEPKLKEGYIVICDRYYHSSLAYQSVEGIDIRWLMQINARCIKPDLTIILDAPAEVCLRRILRDRPHWELYTELSKLERVREAFLEIAKMLRKRGERIVVVRTDQEIEKAHEEIVKHVKSIMEELRKHPTLERFLP